MKRATAISTLACMLFIAGCAAFAPPLEPGATEQAVRERYGQPGATYPDGETVLWEYNGGYWDQQTYMARIGKDHRLISWEPVRTDEKFQTLVIGKSTAGDVLKTVGKPTETSVIRLNNYKVWSYRYKQNGVWDSMMHIMFDDNGVVQKMETGRDPLYDDDRGFWGRRGTGIGIGIGSGRWGSGGGIGIGFGF